jgi:hypothetical protein
MGRPAALDRGAVIERTEFFGLSTIRCSTAFTARTQDDTVRGVFSAKHCGVNESWRTAVGHGPVGVSNLSFSDIDVMGVLWPTSSPAYPGFEGRVFDGAHNSFSKRGVIGSGLSGLDDIVCTSGGYTGIDCRQRVFERNLFFGDPFGGPLFATEQMDGLAAVGQGDSGGPVFAAGLSSTFARGVISAISQGEGRATECLGWVPGSRQCSDWALHAEIQPMLTTLGMQVIHWSESDATGPVPESTVGGQAPLDLAGEFQVVIPPAPAEETSDQGWALVSGPGAILRGPDHWPGGRTRGGNRRVVLCRAPHEPAETTVERCQGAPGAGRGGRGDRRGGGDAAAMGAVRRHRGALV